MPTFAPQAFDFCTVDAQSLAQALGVSFGGATGFSSTGVAFRGPGQSPKLNSPEAQAQNLSSTPALSSLAAALGFGTGRGDQPDATGPLASAPGTAGPSAGTATGDSSTGGSSSTD